jgi:hypothetical protein
LSLLPPRNKKKKGGFWILSSHDPIDVPDGNLVDDWVNGLFRQHDGRTDSEQKWYIPCTPRPVNVVDEDETAMVYVKFEPMVIKHYSESGV